MNKSYFETVISVSISFTGVEYLLEFVREDDPDDVYYVCEMCKCRLSSGSVLPHITGTRHGVAYVVSSRVQKYTGGKGNEPSKLKTNKQSNKNNNKHKGEATFD